jgi:hypothetical protein
VNVRHLLIPLLILSISGCAFTNPFKSEPRVKEVEVLKKAVDKTPLNLPDPAPLKARTPKWIIITPQNAEATWKRLKEENVDIVLFGLTDEGYEELAITMAELRNLIAQQRSIIIKYKEYYEPKKPETPPSK